MSLSYIFEKRETQAIIQRTVKYLRPINRQFCFQALTYEYLSTAAYAEEFYWAMPTVDAYIAESDLASGFLDYGSMRIADRGFAEILTNYIATHTFVHRSGERTVKKGHFDAWTETAPLIYVTSKKLGIAQLVNPFQIRMLRLLEPDADVKVEMP